MVARWEAESCDPGMQNCARVVESEGAEECHLVRPLLHPCQVSRGTYHYLRLDPALQQHIYRELREHAQAWIRGRVELIGTAIYGIRKYTRGAKLMPHLDHMETHVISAILNIRQEVEEPWPLQIVDHDGHQHSVILKPGEMVWYESASLVHARSKPLNGSSFENLFVHYMPRSKLWYRTDWGLKFGRADPILRLEDLEDADVQMRERREEEQERSRMEVQALDLAGSLERNARQMRYNDGDLKATIA